MHPAFKSYCCVVTWRDSQNNASVALRPFVVSTALAHFHGNRSSGLGPPRAYFSLGSAQLCRAGKETFSEAVSVQDRTQAPQTLNLLPDSVIWKRVESDSPPSKFRFSTTWKKLLQVRSCSSNNSRQRGADPRPWMLCLCKYPWCFMPSLWRI